jgi:replicative DNA helicase
MESDIIRLDSVETAKEAKVLECFISPLDSAQYLRADSPDLLVIGARPGIGKTLLGMQIAYNIADNNRTLVFSLEMTKGQLKSRLVRFHNFQEENRELYICDKDGLAIDELVSKALDFHKQKPIDLIIIDYLQIVKGRGMNKSDEMAYVIPRLKMLAKRIKKPVIVLAQLNREIDARLAIARARSKDDDSKKVDVEPAMSDFANSSEIEKWADCAMILVPRSKDKTLIRVSTVKFRHGPKHDFTLELDKKTLMFKERHEEEEF